MANRPKDQDDIRLLIHKLQLRQRAMEKRYSLPEPWYYHLAADLDEVQYELRETTPEEFARRNVYCGANPYRNKYERERHRRTA